MLQGLFDCIAERARSEKEIRACYEEAVYNADQQYRNSLQELEDRYGQQTTTLQQQYADGRRDADQQFHTAHQAAESDHQGALREIENRFEADTATSQQKSKDAIWEANTVCETAERRLKDELQSISKQRQTIKDQIVAAHQQVQETGEEAVELLQERRAWRDGLAPQTAGETADTDEPLKLLAQLVTTAREQFHELSDQTLGHLFTGIRPFLILLPIWMALVVPTVRLLQFSWRDPRWIALSAGLAVIFGGLLLAALYPLARKQAAEAYGRLRETVSKADQVHQLAISQVENQYQQRHKACHERLVQALEKRRQETETAEASLHDILTTATAKRDSAVRDAEATFAAATEQITRRRDQALAQLEGTFPPQLSELKSQYEHDSAALATQREQQMGRITAERDEGWNALVELWRKGLTQFRNEVDTIKGACRELFPDWHEAAAEDWSAPDELPPILPIANYNVDLQELEDGVPEDERLVPVNTAFELPVLLSFPEQASVLIRTSGTGKPRAVELMQLIMLRLLIAVPPGRLRFTVIDPVGLGEKFSGFMHLADYDELLINSRIWTESSHIERRLADLTEHMENVFQKYLRNEYESIQQYNQQAGEVAEPYHFLVVANFPVNISESAARRLMSIITSGPRCGVYTLMSVDVRQRMPLSFDMADVEHHMTCIKWHDTKFVWHHPELGDVRLHLDELPNAQQLRTIVRTVGDQSKDARRVKVTFERVAPTDDQIWCSRSQSGIDVPLGRAGATMLQHMQLGSGTAQHVMIAGKTGSGKSTLLHVMVTNLALYYGPDEVEFYLIDFKKGVEFKTYATHGLPHARVVAIESDREFGLSVLQRLDGVLNERGELFREHGVQDLASYRNQLPEAKLPRILLLIDEFQEFFVEDDRVAQQSALLLDRLVRQGRAFGIHVVLGSQTLSGAYTLARSTLGQVGVRIALECSESDAHVILSDENTAARLLSRPGEAIYNDANGRLEGNHLFQVAWLPDDHRERQLRRIQDATTARRLTPPPPIVFEGNVPADPAACPAFAEPVPPGSDPESHQPPRAWLGEPVAIKDPVSVQFRRQSATNLLMVGRKSDVAMGVMANCLLSLSAQLPPANAPPDANSPRFFVLDGTPPDATDIVRWQQIAQAVPCGVDVAGPRDATRVVGEVAAELTRRQQQADETAEAVFLFVFNLARFRDLRRAADDFGFGLDADKPPGADKQFVEILREGPALGIHTLLWCDSYTNLDRWLTRRSLHDFELRVLLQMSATDSSQLIDGPAAAKLGENRALLYVEESGLLEKFRPYGPPSTEWLADLASRLTRPPDSAD